MPMASDLCFYDDDRIVLLGSTLGEYSIELDRCNTPEKILGWMIHLGTKPWITKMHMELFARRAAEANGIAIDDSGWTDLICSRRGRRD